MFIYYWFQQRFRTASREVKRLDSITKSPVFQHFEETLNGLETVRAYGMQNHSFAECESRYRNVTKIS